MFSFSPNILVGSPRDQFNNYYPERKIKCITYSMGVWFMILEVEDVPRTTSPGFSYGDLYNCIHPYVEKDKRYLSVKIENVSDTLFCLPPYVLLKLEDEMLKASSQPNSI